LESSIDISKIHIKKGHFPSHVSAKQLVSLSYPYLASTLRHPRRLLHLWHHAVSHKASRLAAEKIPAEIHELPVATPE